jgi:Xaa-Pro aminopeptidase
VRKDLDAVLAEKGAGGLLLYSESFKNPNMYYLTKFLAPDPFIFLKKVDCAPLVVLNSMEFLRAQKESVIKDIKSYMDYDYAEVIKAAKEPRLGFLKFLASVVERELGIGTVVCVPTNFPLVVADALRREGLTIQPMFDVVERARETKDPNEIDEIVKVQRVNEKVMSEAIDLIAGCEVGSNKTLVQKTDGKKKPLTAGDLKTLIGHRFLDSWCSVEEEVIVACGSPSSDPHYNGVAEDKIRADQPIVLDLFPRSINRRYWADMTRTVVRGKASDAFKRMFDTVSEAKDVCIEALHAGVLGKEMYDLCCDIIEKAGYDTLRDNKKTTKGFVHSLGHGVGLEIHENPTMSEYNSELLNEHSVVSVEPGLYDPKIGGVRIEDIVEITKKGCNNLTNMPVKLEI